MSEIQKIISPAIEVCLEQQTPIVIEIPKEAKASTIEIEVPGMQGASAVDKPLDFDPLELYLATRGKLLNADNNS